MPGRHSTMSSSKLPPRGLLPSYARGEVLCPGTRPSRALRRAKRQREARFAEQDERRRRMREELERKEKQVATERSAEDTAKARLKEELERLRKKAADKRAAAAAAVPAPVVGGKRAAEDYEMVRAEEEEGAGAAGAAASAQLQEQLTRTIKAQWDASVSEYRRAPARFCRPGVLPPRPQSADLDAGPQARGLTLTCACCMAQSVDHALPGS